MRIIDHIVYIDDDLDDQEIFVSAHNQTCPDVKLTILTDCTTIVSALEAAAMPQIIIIDINMPRVDGNECLQKIRSLPGFDAVKIIMYSTGSSPRQREECLKLGANYFYPKHSSFTEMQNFIRFLCSGAL